MQLFKGIESLTELGETTVTVGSFDGVHSGHLSLLSKLTQRAKEHGRKSVVVSFSPHPRVTLSRAEGLELLTSDREKGVLLSRRGVDALVLLEFTREFSCLSYEQFIEQYLIKRLNMKELVVGFNHQMGHNSGHFEQISQMAQQYNFRATLAQEHTDESRKVSSTAIRELLKLGETEDANRLLSHPYLMIGRSDKQGEVTFDEPLKLIPKSGLYSAIVNHQKAVVEIDKHSKLWSQEKDKEVEIQLISKI